MVDQPSIWPSRVVVPLIKAIKASSAQRRHLLEDLRINGTSSDWQMNYYSTALLKPSQEMLMRCCMDEGAGWLYKCEAGEARNR